MSDMQLVSIIMPIYNSSITLSDSIETVLTQSYTNWELLITDDLSTDDSVKIVEQYAKKDSRIKLFCLADNGGAGNARNNSIKQAQGRFIAFLDSDDIWLPEKLEKQIDFMLKNKYAFTYTAYQKFTEKNDLSIIKPPSETTYEQLLYSNVIGCLTAIYDTKYVGKQYMPLIRKRQDMGLWLNILKVAPKAYCLNEVLAKYRIDSGMSQHKWSAVKYQWKFYRQVVGLGFFKTIAVFSVYALKGYLKSNK
ncbi:glycosyltransferase family 2 protein [Psychromonas ossibalaenae]|uniref:glycosyltransferase family 2 protein n=1 Tax=Psychromonas ossibalaenae TaxID=444922 RepID=UPI000366CB8D|nr:glycosyltransferase family 2 protein [Psychromonas ossibalaenae]